MFLFIYLFASVMARRCGGAEYPSSEHNFNIKEMLSEAGWCLVAHRSLREKMIRARDPPCIYSGGNIIWNTDCCHGWKIFVESWERWPGRSLQIVSHPLNGWFGLAKDCDITIIGKGVRHSDFKQKRPWGKGHSVEVSGRTNTLPRIRGWKRSSWCWFD